VSDTGAPWNLPFPLPTDLVRDGADAIKDLAEATATGLSAIPVLAGIGSNVVQTVKSDVFTSTSGSFTNVTGLSVTITPSSNTSRILVIGQISAGRGTQGRLTGGNSSGFIGDSAGSRTRATFTGPATSTVGENPRGNPTYSLVFLDSPATASAVTYQIQVRFENTGSGDPGAQINRRTTDTNDALTTRNVSSLVAIEVAA